MKCRGAEKQYLAKYTQEYSTNKYDFWVQPQRTHSATRPTPEDQCRVFQEKLE